MNATIKRCTWTALVFLLAACGTVTSPSTPTVDATAIFSQAAATTQAQLTEIAASQPTATPSPTIPPTTTIEPSPTVLPLATVDGLRMAYIIDGNLYVQDSGQQPKQLTNSGLDRKPIISHDGKKIIFYRGEAEATDKYSINVDGSQEKILIPLNFLTNLNLGYSKFTQMGNFAFLPGTHELLFQTVEVKPWNDNEAHLIPMDVRSNQDLLLLDIDTMKVKQLLAPKKGGWFDISPDGKMDIGITGDYIDLIGIYGQFNRRHMLIYQPNWNYSWHETFWTQDSSKCIFVVPIGGSGDGTDGARPDTLWQYSVNSNSAIEIQFNPPPIDDNYALSPDGNWIAYIYFYLDGKTDETTLPGFYIGSLNDGSSKLVEKGAQFIEYGMLDNFHWSPDNEHYVFLLNGDSELYLGNKQGNITLVNKATTSGKFLGWIDDNHYLYQNKDVIMGEIGKEGDLIVVDLPDNYSNLTYVFVKPK